MYKNRCDDASLMKPSWDCTKKELTIPCLLVVAEDIIENSKYEFAPIETRALDSIEAAVMSGFRSGYRMAKEAQNETE